MIFNKNTSVFRLIQCSMFYDMKSTIEEIGTYDIPRKIGNYEVPETLDSITFGQRIELSEMNNDIDFLFKPLVELAKMDKNDISKLKARDVIRFNQFVISELKRFNKRDETLLKYHFDPEEIKAGINKMNHGIFGTIDVIAKRMNISHDDVLELSQAKVFMMLKIDIDNANYQKTLREVIKKEN